MKCLVFCACERVLFDQQNNPSLIILIENLSAPIPGPVPKNAIIPKEWSVFTLWYPDPEEYGKSFEQKIEFEMPSGERTIKASVGFTFNAQGAAQRVHTPFLGFPIGEQGFCKIHMWMESNGGVVTPDSVYKVNLIHQPAPAAKEFAPHEIQS